MPSSQKPHPSNPKVTTTTTTTTTEKEEDKSKTAKKVITPTQSEKFNKALEELFEANKRFYSDIVEWHTTTEQQPKRAKIIDRDKQKNVMMMTKTMMSSPVMQTLMMSTLNDIEITSPQKILSMNRGLIHLLYIIDKAPNGQISTRKLLDGINSRDLHHLIKKGESLGFIRREKVPKPKGERGNNMTINSLTPEGRALLRVADDLLVS
jgi:DNA-binding MarR family transcriptional regulator